MIDTDFDKDFILCNLCGAVNYEDSDHQVYECAVCGQEAGLSEGYTPEPGDEVYVVKYGRPISVNREEVETVIKDIRS